MRALNEEVADFSTLVRCTDRALTETRASGSRIRIGAGVTMAGVLANPDLAFLPFRRPLGRRTRGARASHGRGQPVRAPALRRLRGRAARARRPRCRPQRIQPARDIHRRVPARSGLAFACGRRGGRVRAPARRTLAALPQGIEGAAEGCFAARHRRAAGGVGGTALRGAGRLLEHGPGADARRCGRARPGGSAAHPNRRGRPPPRLRPTAARLPPTPSRPRGIAGKSCPCTSRGCCSPGPEGSGRCSGRRSLAQPVALPAFARSPAAPESIRSESSRCPTRPSNSV